MEIIETVKILLGVDDDKDDVLTEIITLTSSKILSYIKEDKVPKTLNWIVIEMAIKRYNRIGSEGMKAENIDGASVTYEEDELTGYYTHLDEYNRTHKKKGWCLI